jgi:hypothetical protein
LDSIELMTGLNKFALRYFLRQTTNHVNIFVQYLATFQLANGIAYNIKGGIFLFLLLLLHRRFLSQIFLL